MRKLTRAQQNRTWLFLIIFIASLMGNGLGYWLLHQRDKSQEQFFEIALEKLDRLEKAQRDLQYRSAQFEQAMNEKQQLQRALDAHQQFMENSHRQFAPSDSPPPDSSAK